MTKKKDSTNKWGFSELILILLIFSPYVFTSIRLDHLMIVILMVILLFQKLHKGAAISVVFLVGYYISNYSKNIYNFFLLTL